MSVAGVAVAMLLILYLPHVIPITGGRGGGSYLGFWPWPALEVWFLALAVPFFINIASFALNDYFDIETDRKNGRKERPLVSGALSPHIAAWTAAAGYLAGIAAGWLLSPICGVIATLFALLSVAYNYRLKDWPLIGNAYIALSMAIAFPFGAGAVMFQDAPGLGNMMGAGWQMLLLLAASPLTIFLALPAPILWLTAGAFFAGLSRELIKSVQDMKGDRAARGSKHLPILIGARAALILAGLLAAGFCASLLWLVTAPGGPAWNIPSLGLLAVSGLAYLANAIELMGGVPKPGGLERMRKTTLYALMLALAAVALAVLI